jgi:hypothetical protein
MYGNDFMRYKEIRDALNADVVGGEAVDVVDVVNSPPHYTAGGIEAIDAIEAALSDEGFRGALKANVLKYLWRYEKKADPVADLRKARWYLDRLIQKVEGA